MSISTSPSVERPQPTPKQAILAKIFHWLNIVALLLMVTSGLQIYNANPVFGGRSGWLFPKELLLGGWLGGGRHFHFAAMWLFGLNLLWYGIYVLISRRWTQRFFGNSDRKALLKSQNQKRKNYAWHRLAYTLIMPVLFLALLSGFGMYKPVQFHWIVDLFGNWQALRVVHFISVPTIVIFSLIHSFLGLRVGGTRLIKSMFL